MQNTVILETKDLCKYYGSGENEVRAIDHTSLQIYQGEFAAIVGKSRFREKVHFFICLEDWTALQKERS